MTEHAYDVRSSTERFNGTMFRVVSDEVTMPGGGVAVRDYLVHPGAVGVVAIDGEGRVVLVRQYRHPVRRRLWELPAGLIDKPGEDLAATAARELAEEADLAAGRLEPLIDLHTSAGCSSESIRLFLARDLREVPPPERHQRFDEEADMVVRRFHLDEAVQMIFNGEITNAAAVAGVLAAAHGWVQTVR